jgi:DNA polymerase-3 subunit epsilon
MNSTKRSFFVLLALAGLFVVAPILAGWVLFWFDLSAEDKAAFIPLVEPRIPLIVATIVFGAIYCMMVVRPLYKRYVILPQRMAEDIRLLLAQPGRRVEPYGATELQVIAAAVNELADRRQALETDVEERVARAKQQVEDERNRLAALMGELTQSVVVCNLDGRILLYNNRARLQFRTIAGTSAAGGGEILGLGRSIYAAFARELISHALESIQQGIRKRTEQPVANFVTTTKSGQLLRVQMAAVLSAADDPADRVLTGYVLMLDNITVMFDKESKRDALLQSLTEGNRAALGSIRAASEMLIDVPDMSADERASFLAVIRAESEQMSERLSAAATQFVDALKGRWPLEEMRGADLIAATARRIGSVLSTSVRQDSGEIDESVWIKVDSFSLIQALTYLASRLVDEYEIREIRFRLGSEGRLAHLDLCWQGATMSTETVMNWELESMRFAGESSPLTVREVVDRCDGEMWFQRERVSHLSFFRFALPIAKPRDEVDEAAFMRAESRPDYYDFDLFNWSERSHAFDDRKLTELAYTVFDTETTGLQPRQGDEIIQIGATRILNGKLLRNEFFEQLVDPRRELPPPSTAIHGITPEMLTGRPPIGEVLPAFHAFAADTVLVAHNAAFDMRFLQIKEESTGIRFDHPVLDTLLLSAVIHPHQESHRLEAIAERLGITIIGRHTAMGDAIVTGEVFLRMLPLLADMGIVTLRQAIEASQKTYYARVEY